MRPKKGKTNQSKAKNGSVTSAFRPSVAGSLAGVLKRKSAGVSSRKSPVFHCSRCLDLRPPTHSPEIPGTAATAAVVVVDVRKSDIEWDEATRRRTNRRMKDEAKRENLTQSSTIPCMRNHSQTAPSSSFIDSCTRTRIETPVSREQNEQCDHNTTGRPRP